MSSMRKWSTRAALAAGVTIIVAIPGAAQQGSLPGSDVLTLSVFGGGLSPTSDLGTGGFDTGGTVGATAGVWLGRYLGIRASGLWSRTEAGGGVPEGLGGQEPDVWLYTGDVLLRYPWRTGGGAASVYVVGGLGGKTYDFELTDAETDFAGTFGGGVEVRFGSGRWGLQAEVRDVVSSFDAFGVDDTQHDVVWTGGITLSY